MKENLLLLYANDKFVCFLIPLKKKFFFFGYKVFNKYFNLEFKYLCSSLYICNVIITFELVFFRGIILCLSFTFLIKIIGLIFFILFLFIYGLFILLSLII